MKVIKDIHLKQFPEITHGFFTRHGGVSQGIYASLNCCYSGQDDPNLVAENRRRAMHYFDYSIEQLATVKNVNGNHVQVIQQPYRLSQLPEADAMVSCTPGIMLGSDSADCPIVLFADPIAKVVGLAHAGWKGALSGIIALTVDKMLELGAQPQQLVAAIGPCIAQDSYEVGTEFHTQFIAADPNNMRFFKAASKSKHYLFDLPGYVKYRLEQLGLHTISHIALDTYTLEDLFFSCRRAFHRQEPDFGGHLSCIGLSHCDYGQLSCQ